MDDNRGIVVRQLELYLLQHSQQQADEAHCRLFGLKPQVFTSWLTVLANLRNMCCHHARVWNRVFMLNPAEPRKTANAWIDDSKVDKKRIYYRLCIIRYFLASVSPDNNFNEKLSGLLACFPSIDIAAMGFSRDWENEDLWKQDQP